jgi:hypothetical protein
MTIKPLSKIRYLDKNIEREVKFQHIIIFALSGLLVIFCAHFNYIMLFICRFKIRQKEFALRSVFGASKLSQLAMLSIEFLFTIMCATVLGICFTYLFIRDFLTLSEITMKIQTIYSQSLIYIAGIVIVSLIAFCLTILFFNRKSLHASIINSYTKFHKISIIVQLFISVGFAFCAIVIIKQMHFLHNTDELGFSFKNRASIQILDRLTLQPDGSFEYPPVPAFVSILQQIPEITEVFDAGQSTDLLPQRGRETFSIDNYDNMKDDAQAFEIETMYVLPDYPAFYDFQLIAGEMLTETDDHWVVLINEFAANAFGWDDPIGKEFSKYYIVKGVIKHVCNLAPTAQAKPVFYRKAGNSISSISILPDGGYATQRLILFKYHEGTWNEVLKKVEQLRDEHYIVNIFNTEEEYEKYLKSERNLIKLLSFVSIICILICIFGFVSIITLSCQERRKSIAIHKVNGAKSVDILDMFAKEYVLLLLIGSVIAFAAGYYIMQRWLENYVKQTSIPLWIYALIICVLASIVVLCVGWRVYRSSIENPVEVIKLG